MDFLYVKKNSISKELCDEIIYKYEQQGVGVHFDGVTAGGKNTEIKHTTDMQLLNDDNWGKIYTFLMEEIGRNIKEYINKLNENTYQSDNSSYEKYRFFHNTKVSVDTFLMQRYIKQVGRYIYHTDNRIIWESKKHRIITFIWYLNTVEEGGETEICGTHRIKPEAGKLLFFPACWTYPHTGKMPISDNKYIITGWIYLNDE